jgi:Asp-tRNA(Asn)/Glu-tRNA(Gln) amidotransferase B subunit
MNEEEKPEHIETHQDDRFVYGETWLSGSMLTTWMRPKPTPPVEENINIDKKWAKLVANFFMNELSAYANEHKLKILQVIDPEALYIILDMLYKKEISHNSARIIFQECADTCQILRQRVKEYLDKLKEEE